MKLLVILTLITYVSADCKKDGVYDDSFFDNCCNKVMCDICYDPMIGLNEG